MSVTTRKLRRCTRVRNPWVEVGKEGRAEKGQVMGGKGGVRGVWVQQKQMWRYDEGNKRQEEATSDSPKTKTVYNTFKRKASCPG